MERFGYFHPDAIRLAKTIGALATRRQALRNDEAMAHDPTGVTQPRATSTVTSHTLARMSIALQRNNAMTLHTASGTYPTEDQQERSCPLQGQSPLTATRSSGRSRLGG